MALATTVLPVLAGIASHVLYFRPGEHQTRAAMYARAVVMAPVIGAFACATLLDISYLQAAALSLRLQAYFLVGLYSSMLVYRAFFHRLSRFPGPVSWRLSKLTHAWANRDLMNYKHLDALFRQYGEYVRTGPNEIMTIDPDACNDFILRCGRGPWYDGSKPEVSLLTTREKPLHDRRRRVWDRGFGARALRDYEPRVASHVAELSVQMGKRTSQTLNFAEWINYFSFDVMGDLSFGRSFNILPTGKKPKELDLLEEGQKPLAFLGTMPWLFQILLTIPGLTAGHYRFMEYCNNLMDERVEKKKTEHDDIASWLIDGLYSETGAGATKAQRKEEMRWLHGDSRLVIVAGSDTTAATLSYCMHYLCAEPIHVARIRAELSRLETQPTSIATSTGDNPDMYDARDLQNHCDYLNAFINEALRMHPAVPGGFMRITPPEGVVIKPTSPNKIVDDRHRSSPQRPAWLDAADAKPADGVYIPGDVNIWMPIYTLSRNPRAWTAPDTFAPGRWLDADKKAKLEPALAPQEAEPEILRKEAFLTFSTGPMGCVGRQLALQEMRLVIAALVARFDVGFAPGETGRALVHDTRDWFTLGLAPLNVVFSERKAQ